MELTALHHGLTLPVTRRLFSLNLWVIPWPAAVPDFTLTTLLKQSKHNVGGLR